MQWMGITIVAPTGEAEETVIQLLLNAGCAGVALSDEGAERLVTSYLPTDEHAERRLRQISGAIALLPELGISGVGEPRLSAVDEEDWANSWKAYFKPLRIGRRLVVSPPWETPELSERDVLIEIDPGMAFGTGTHATTQMCLALIEEYLRPGDSVADIGTGSGILSIAADKLGASSVTAVDNDPLAVKIAGENSAANKAAIETSEEFPNFRRFNLVVANIVADTLIALADRLAAITEDNGLLIVSGVIDERQNEVRLFIEGAGFASIETREQGEWAALVFRRTSS